MKPGSVLVDISIDQGGCFEDSRPTTHAEPTFKVHDSVFYCVANMPGAVPHTSTYALTNVTLPYAVELANRGWRDALRNDHGARTRTEHARGPARPTSRSPRRTATRPSPSRTCSADARRWPTTGSCRSGSTNSPGRSHRGRPLPGDERVDVAIVGAGFTGLWTAYYLQRARPGAADRDPRGRDRRLRRVRAQRRMVLGAVPGDASRPSPPRSDGSGRSPSTPRCASRSPRWCGSPRPRASTPTSPRAGRSCWPARARSCTARARRRHEAARVRPGRRPARRRRRPAPAQRHRRARRHLHPALRGDAAGEAGAWARRRRRGARRTHLRAHAGHADRARGGTHPARPGARAT